MSPAEFISVPDFSQEFKRRIYVSVPTAFFRNLLKYLSLFTGII